MSFVRNPCRLAPSGPRGLLGFNGCVRRTAALLGPLFLSANLGCSDYLAPKSDSDGPSATESTKAGDTDSSGEAPSEQSPGPDSQDKPETFKPSGKTVYFKLLGDIPEDNLRIMVKPGLELTMDKPEETEAMVDIEATFKSKRVKVKIPPLDEEVRLGFAKFAILLTTLYIDNDESEDYSEDDQIIATVVNAPIYARTGNAPRIGEWTRLDLESNKMVPIDGSIPLNRVDDIEPVTSLTFRGRELDIAKGVNLAATLGILEHRSFPKELNEAPRPILAPIDLNKPLHEFKIEAPLDEARWFEPEKDKTPPLVGVKNFGLELLAGLHSKTETLDENSQFIALGCIRRTQGPAVGYDPVTVLWIEPGKDWVTSPLGAFLMMRSNFKPGWNAAVARETQPDQYSIGPLFEQDLSALGFYRDCRFTPRPTYVLENSFFGPRSAQP